MIWKPVVIRATGPLSHQNNIKRIPHQSIRRGIGIHIAPCGTNGTPQQDSRWGVPGMYPRGYKDLRGCRGPWYRNVCPCILTGIGRYSQFLKCWNQKESGMKMLYIEKWKFCTALERVTFSLKHFSFWTRSTAR